MDPSRPGTASPVLRAAVSLAAVGYGAATVAVATEAQRATSYFAVPGTTAAGLVSGGAAIVVGVALVLAGDAERWGRLAVALGVVWFAPVWVGWEAGPAAVRSTASVVAPLLVPLLVHVWLRARGRSPGYAVLLATAYAGVAVLVGLRALLHDPHRDRYCWVDCGPGANVFLVHGDIALARGLGTGLLVLVVALAAGVAATTPVRSARTTDPARGAVVLAAVLALAGEGAYAAVLLLDPWERYDSEPGTTLFLLRSVAVLAVVAAVGWAGTGAGARRRRVADLARDLDGSGGPGDLQAHLARSLRDPGLRIDYWSSLEGRYVDARGRPAHDRARPGAASVPVVHGGRPVALIHHDPRRSDAGGLSDQLGSGARLALDNERLSAERLAQVEALKRSRARIVEAADQQRRALERDLHDGAQQRLIAATFELRLAAAEADAAEDECLAEELRATVDRTSAVLEQLRDFAHGVFPAVLDEAGLGEAVLSLADVAPRPVRPEVDLVGAPPADAARAAYLVARTAVQATPDRQPTELVLRLSDGSGPLVVEAAGVGPVDLLHLTDRVGAVGGIVRLSGDRLWAVIP